MSKVTEPKVTPWYAPWIKPSRVGWYSVVTFDGAEYGDFMNYWDGVTWFYNDNQSRGAPAKIVGKYRMSQFDYWYWRGRSAP